MKRMTVASNNTKTCDFLIAYKIKYHRLYHEGIDCLLPHTRHL